MSMEDHDGDGDRSDPPPLPSTYVTLVQLQQRWLQEKQRKQREKEEQEQEEEGKRKRQEDEQQQHQQQKQGNLQKRPVESTTGFPRRNRRPQVKTSMQYRAIVESESTDDLKAKEGKNKKKKNKGNKNWKPRAEEDLVGGKEQLLPEMEGVVAVDKIPVVSTERNHRKTQQPKNHRRNKRGKARVEEDPKTQCGEHLLEKEVEAENDVVVVSVVSSCEKDVWVKCEEGVSASGGQRGNGRYPRGGKMRGKPRVVEDLTTGREQLLLKEFQAEKNVVVVSVVSNERDGGFGGSGEGLVVNGGRVLGKDLAKNVLAVVSNERDGGFVRSGKDLVVNGGRVWEKRVGRAVDRSERVLGKFEGLSVRGGGHVKNAWDVNGGPRRYGRGKGRILQRLGDSNLVWVKKEEGDTSDANVAGV